MKIHFGFSAWASKGLRSVSTVGNFDGVHIGHQAILHRVVSRASEFGCTSVVITFDPVPKKILQPETAPPMIQTLEQRLRAIEALKIDHTIVVAFDLDFARKSPEEFIEQYLVGALAIRGIVVGENFSFGHEKKGNVQLLRSKGEKHGFIVEGIPEVKIGDVRISSTLIRAKIAAGAMEDVQLYMGRPFALVGTVVHGDKIGGTIGIPTANLRVENELLPASGVYVCRASLANGESWPAVTNVGTRPTVGGRNLTVEAHLLHYSGNLYGMKMELAFYRKLREELRFQNLDELKSWIQSDIRQAETYFK
jgi:riboflavin kinase / FMN adenylyltransferase